VNSSAKPHRNAFWLSCKLDKPSSLTDRGTWNCGSKRYGGLAMFLKFLGQELQFIGCKWQKLTFFKTFSADTASVISRRYHFCETYLINSIHFILNHSESLVVCQIAILVLTLRNVIAKRKTIGIDGRQQRNSVVA
jgi:hypothetical protein